MNNTWSKLLLLKTIDEMKKKLIEIDLNTGLNSQETLSCSQRLDDLLNLHLKFLLK
ncbi:aspartyl-phosphate phosphatase Spo0E family protein [Neobacillus drentensis]|uniref:aspartyl-phosphate phosphatase Spo0E family protein n=1 Tax=Neobacillus drentensis TaxID=220684 RepID=UPI001F3CEEAA|nr:aspartyl-phosphate phosphatase Spo0E family protein [Neobacillus drentensis]ULT59531.1 aspartyl-phosphate phosphatase Spo0E family protein [Neobacillus drentensis]